MAISKYKKEVEPGVYKTMYEVIVESKNKYTGKRTQRRRRNIPSKPKAERLYRELWMECREQKPKFPKIRTWDDLSDHYFSYLESQRRSPENPNGYSGNTIRKNQNYLKHTYAWDKIHYELITPHFVSVFLDEKEADGLSRGMANEILQLVKLVFAHAVEIGLVPYNPFVGVKARKVPEKRKQALTHEEVDILLSEAKKRSHPYYEIWALTIALGLRRSELAGLKWSDIDWEHGLIHLQRQLNPLEGIVDVLKSRKDRVVAIPESIMPLLKQMKLRSKADFVIAVKCKEWQSGRQAGVLRSFCREIGIKEVTHHQLRATHITLALVDGVPLGIVKENVGHAKLSTTDKYFRSAGINMRGQMNGLKLKMPTDSMAKTLEFKKIT